MIEHAQRNYVQIYKPALLAFLNAVVYTGLIAIFAIPIAIALPFYTVHGMFTGEL